MRRRLLVVEEAEAPGVEDLVADPAFRILQRNSGGSWTAYAATAQPNSFRFGGGRTAREALEMALRGRNDYNEAVPSAPPITRRRGLFE